ELTANVVVDVLDAAGQPGLGLEAFAAGQPLAHLVTAVLAGELEQLGAVERARLGRLDRLPVALLPVADEVGVEHARPADTALEEGEVQIGEAAGDPPQEERLAHGGAGPGGQAGVADTESALA